MIKLSQCMIVKNEETNIRRALEWAKGIAYEQIVVDTGSTDRTAEIAREMGAKVFDFPWINDFSAAKNFAIEQAGGDWIAFLDADEYIGNDDACKLLPLLTQINGIKVDKAGYKDVKVDIVRCNMLELNADGEVTMVHLHERFFRRKKNLRYTGKIHEVLAPTDGVLPLAFNLEDDIKIYHTGYAWTPELQRKKAERNEKMLLEQLKDNTDTRTLLYYADTLMLAGKKDEALKYFIQGIEKDDGSAYEDRLLGAYKQLLMLLAESRADENTFMRYYKMGKKKDEGYPDIELARGFWSYNRQDYKDSLRSLELALELAGRKTYNYSSVQADRVRVNEMIADCHEKIKVASEIIRVNNAAANKIMEELQSIKCTEEEHGALCTMDMYNQNNLPDTYIKCKLILRRMEFEQTGQEEIIDFCKENHISEYYLLHIIKTNIFYKYKVCSRLVELFNNSDMESRDEYVKKFRNYMDVCGRNS